MLKIIIKIYIKILSFKSRIVLSYLFISYFRIQYSSLSLKIEKKLDNFMKILTINSNSENIVIKY